MQCTTTTAALIRINKGQASSVTSHMLTCCCTASVFVSETLWLRYSRMQDETLLCVHLHYCCQWWLSTFSDKSNNTCGLFVVICRKKYVFEVRFPFESCLIGCFFWSLLHLFPSLSQHFSLSARFISMKFKSVTFIDSSFHNCFFEDVSSVGSFFNNCTFVDSYFYNTGQCTPSELTLSSRFQNFSCSKCSKRTKTTKTLQACLRKLNR